MLSAYRARDWRTTERLRLLEQRPELDRAVEQRVLRVQVQMREAVFRDHAADPPPRILARHRRPQAILPCPDSYNFV